MSSGINWTDETINPIVGCSKVSPACDNCYAEVMANRLQSMGVDGYDNVINANSWTNRLNFVESALLKPYRWKKPKRIFIGSMTDLFHDKVDNDWIWKILKMVKENPQHTFMFLTKRAKNMKEVMERYYFHAKCEVIKNLWLGVTAENQKYANERIPYLLDTPASKRFVSIEPMLEDMNLDMLIADNSNDRFRIVYSSLHGVKTLWDTKNLIGEENITKLDWVIVGGESGSKARILNPRWVKSIQEQCSNENVPFFFKQWGEFIEETQLTEKEQYRDLTYSLMSDGELSFFRCGRKLAGKLINGKEHQAFPIAKKEIK